MRLRYLHARKIDRDGVHAVDRSQPFAAVDPGAQGAAIIVERGAILSIRPLLGAPAMLEAAWEITRHRARLLVVEEQFLAKDFQATVRIARSAALLIGMVCAMVDEYEESDDHTVQVVWVPPDSWARPALGLRGPKKRGERKAAALALGARDLGDHPRYRAASKELKSGIADAYGIARWWLRLGPGRTECGSS